MERSYLIVIFSQHVLDVQDYHCSPENIFDISGMTAEGSRRQPARRRRVCPPKEGMPAEGGCRRLQKQWYIKIHWVTNYFSFAVQVAEYSAP